MNQPHRIILLERKKCVKLSFLFIEKNVDCDGGVVAVNYEGVIARCYSKVNFDYQLGITVGGIAGYNEGEIRDCYYGGDIKVDAGQSIGGIFSEDQGVVENCYNVGTFLLGYAIVGGVGGGNSVGGTVDNCVALCATWEDIAGAYYNVIGYGSGF